MTSGGTESVPARGEDRPRRAPRRRATQRMVVPTTAHAAFHKAAHYFGVERVPVPVGDDFRADPAAMAAAHRRQHRAGRRVGAVVRPRGGGPRHGDRRRSPRAPGSAATSTRASAAGCCRTPRGSAGRAAVDLRRRGRHQHLGRPAQVRLHAQGRLAAAAPHARAATRAVLRERRLAGLHDAELDDAVHQVRRTARRGLGGGASDRRRGLRAARRQTAFDGRGPRWSRGSTAVDGVAGRRATGLDARRAGDRRHRATCSRSPTR